MSSLQRMTVTVSTWGILAFLLRALTLTATGAGLGALLTTFLGVDRALYVTGSAILGSGLALILAESADKTARESEKPLTNGPICDKTERRLDARRKGMGKETASGDDSESD